MKEINRIHLAKVPYEIEIDAKKELTKYFNDLQKYANDESIFDDVEIRVTEILSDLGVNKNDIISLEDVSKIKKQLGDPEVFAGPDIVTETDEYEVEDANIKETVAKKKIYRDKSTAMIAGIASGLSVYLNIDVVLVRIIFLILVPVTFCWIIPIYIILWILIPSAKTASDILRLRGEKISAQSIKQVNEEYNFSLQEKRNDSVKTFFGILLGLGSVFAALIGLTLLVFVNIAVINDSTDSAVLNSYQGVPMALFSLAGILFVAFSITMAYIGFSRKITQSQIIALPVVIFIGITSFIAGFYVININESNHQSKIQQSIEKREISVDKTRFSSIDSLNINSNINVKYIVSSERRVEIVKSKYLDGVDDREDISFNDKTLMVNIKRDNSSYINYEKLIIYGPEIKNIISQNDSEIYYEPNPKQESLYIEQNAAGSAVKIDNKVYIKNLSVVQSENSGFEGDKLDVENLKINIKVENATFEIGSAKNVEIASLDVCEDQYYYNSPTIIFDKAGISSFKVNEQIYESLDNIKCLNIETNK